jgi:hypothetical protein
MMSHDGRAAEDHGIAVSSHALDFTTDTRFPLMVDDSALDPAMTEFPDEPKGRWTDMTLACMMYQTNCSIQRLYRLLPSGENSAADLDKLEAARADLVSQLRSRIEAHVNVCHPLVPKQRATILMAKSVINKLDFISRQQWLNIRLGMEDVTDTPVDKRRKREAFATDENLAIACEIMEQNHQCLTDDLLTNFRWVATIYQQLHVLLW